VVYKEIKHLSMLKNVKQVVTLYEIFESGNEIYIVMEVRCS
jgi:serine/threonine protein kinase